MSTPTILETIKTWLGTYSGFDILSQFQVDYTDQIPNNAGIFPSGLVELSRKEDILGNITVTNQINFGIYCVFNKSTNDDTGATYNQEWIADFQNWVQGQSVTRQIPQLGDNPRAEVAIASNGVLYDATEEGLGTYMVQLSFQYEKRY